MFHNGKKTKNNNGLISSLLMVFARFEIHLSYEDKKLDVVSIKFINCKRETGLNSETSSYWVFDEVITKFVLNEILHHVGMSWVISSNQEMEYEMDENNHQDWLNKGPWYNTSICSKLHGSMFEDFITQARTDRYNLMCCLVAYDRFQLDYKDDESSIGYRAIPDDATIKTLEDLSAILIVLGIFLNITFIALIYASHLASKFSRSNLSHISIKLIVAPNSSNAYIVASSGIALSTIILS